MTCLSMAFLKHRLKLGDMPFQPTQATNADAIHNPRADVGVEVDVHSGAEEEELEPGPAASALLTTG